MSKVIHVKTQEQWNDVSKRLGYVWLKSSTWDLYGKDSYIRIDCFAFGKISSFDDVISYEDFIKDRIDSAEDVNRIYKENRLHQLVISTKEYGTETLILADCEIYKLNDKGILEKFGIRFSDINIEETQKLIIKEKDKMNVLSAKDVLKENNVVKLRSGDLYYYTNGVFMCSNGHNWLSVESYDDDLKIGKTFDCLNIVEIFTTSGYSFETLFVKERLKSIWKIKEKSKQQLEYEAMEKQMAELQEKMKKFKEDNIK